MPRGKQGSKAGRSERNRLFQAALKERKRLRKQRAAALRSIATMHDRLGEPNVIGYYPSADGIPDDDAFRSSPELVDALLDTFERPHPAVRQAAERQLARAVLEQKNVAPLRDIARELGLKPGRARKAELIDAILAKDWAVRNDG